LTRTPETHLLVETLLFCSQTTALKLKWVSLDALVGGLAGSNQQKCEGKRSGHYCVEVGVWVRACGWCWEVKKGAAGAEGECLKGRRKKMGIGEGLAELLKQISKVGLVG
jgi:hypothetical protein